MAAETWDIRDLIREAPTPRLLTTAEVAALAEEVAAYHAHFGPYFTRSEQRAWAGVYLRGLLIADIPRKNTEAMALRLLGAGDGADRRVRALQQFIGEGGWGDDAILAEHRRLVDRTLGEADGVLIVDESAVPKRGDHSAGVARQWCGVRGKQENCQTPRGHPASSLATRVGRATRCSTAGCICPGSGSLRITGSAGRRAASRTRRRSRARRSSLAGWSRRRWLAGFGRSGSPATNGTGETAGFWTGWLRAASAISLRCPSTRWPGR